MRPKTAKNPKGAGGPITHIDWNMAKSLAEIQCTDYEIAHVLKTTRQTLSSHCKTDNHCSLEEFISENSQGGKASLRRLQFQVAKGGNGKPPNPTMLIWLGKQYLGQSDKQEMSAPISIQMVPGELTDEQLAVIAATNILSNNARRSSTRTAEKKTGKNTPH